MNSIKKMKSRLKGINHFIQSIKGSGCLSSGRTGRSVVLIKIGAWISFVLSIRSSFPEGVSPKRGMAVPT